MISSLKFDLLPFTMAEYGQRGGYGLTAAADSPYMVDVARSFVVP